ncbi:hypothetical protein OF83DRAFT_336885 [Amylostereum chailletii]|nr:hypothetical protein OF83DRAFT_336885 [Amylostereum chailletii]
MERLTQAGKDLLNTDFVAASGTPVFRVSTPSRSTTHLARFVPTSGGGSGSGSGGLTTVPTVDIEWHRWSETIFRMEDREEELEEYLPKEDGLTGRKRRFTARSGRSYLWNTIGNACVLSLPDGREVGHYQERSTSIFRFGRARPAFLELATDVLDDFDEIAMTFVYMRRKQEHRLLAIDAEAGV